MRSLGLAAAALVALDILRFVFFPEQDFFTDGFEVIVAAVCVAACLRAATRSVAGGERTAWLLVATHFGLLLLADLHDLLAAFSDHPTSGLMALELLGWLTYLPLAFLCVAPLGERSGFGSRSVIPLLDFVQAALVLIVAYYAWVYFPHVAAETTWRAVGRPDVIRNAAIAIGLSARAVGEPAARMRRLFAWIAGMFLVSRFLQGIALHSLVSTVYAVVRPSIFLIFAIVAMQWTRPQTRAQAEPQNRWRELATEWMLGVLPAAAPVFVAVVAERRATLILWPVFILSGMIFMIRTGFGEHERLTVQALRRVKEEELQEAEARFRALSENALVGVAIVENGRFTYANPALAQMAGRSRAELTGTDPLSLIHPNDQHVGEEIIRTFAAGEAGAVVREVQGLRADGEIRQIVLMAVTVELAGRKAVVSNMLDITEQRALESRLLHSQKMEAVGRLASGVAHDFNNILQAMVMTSQMLRRKERGSAQVQKATGEIEELVQRATGLTRQLLIFSRQETVRRETFDLGKVAGNLSKMLRRLVREDITLDMALADEPLLIDADPGQIEQVIMNLVVNACDAMPDGGTITIRTGADARERTWIEIADSGQGIPSAIRRQIFEPFFTTKGVGKGTGLGLSVVREIVTSHGGEIEVGSEVGKGSTFRVLFPLARAREILEKEPAGGPFDVPRGSGQRILVVEDEPAARAKLHETLVSLGYAVHSVASGEEAQQLPLAEPPFDLLLTDVVLGGIAGPDLARELLRRWPLMRTVFMSGYVGDEVLRWEITTRGVRFLQKPFDIPTLARQLFTAFSDAPSALHPGGARTA